MKVWEHQPTLKKEWKHLYLFFRGWCSVLQMRSKVSNVVMNFLESAQRADEWSPQHPWVSAGASRMITSAPLNSQLHTVFPPCIHIFFSLCLHLFSYHPPSFPDRRYFWTSSVGWIWGWFPVAVGCNPEVHSELSQSPPWASHVPDLWHRAFEGHFRFLGEEPGLLDSGQTAEPTGERHRCFQG